MVFAKSRPLLARYDVSPHMLKWWKSSKGSDGQISRHLSPYEQQAIMPWVRTFPKRAYDKFMDSFVYWGGASILTVGTTVLADQADAAQDYTHRF
mmetsp:Transcript_21970/g.30882  ORF Transcript_21970/g.30882 Transcript_21970/m.30882 type:complete len:95 (+) Transcript_21970:56-340(+)